MTEDPTLAIAFPADRLERSDSQSEIPLRPQTWNAYERIAAVGELPSSLTRAELANACRTALKDSSDDALRRLFVLTMMWGSGTRNGRGPRNTDKALASKDLTSILRRSRELLEAGDPASAYLLHHRVPGIGPAFFTKWLWVVGSAIGCQPQPLIQDSLVWKALGGLGWDSREAASSQSWGERYVAYLHACEKWAADATGEHTPEDIEYSLFRWGKSPD